MMRASERTRVIKKVLESKAGFLPIQEEAETIYRQHPPEECLTYALGFYQEEPYQVQELAVFILGMIAARLHEAVAFLKDTVSRNGNWRVQEILAKAFDTYCRDNAYEKSLPVIREWLGDETANTRRAVTEGLRIWTGRPYFKEHPSVAIELLAAHRDDESEYVRMSVGNALRDISKKFPVLIEEELKTWNLSDKKVLQTSKLAGKFIAKQTKSRVTATLTDPDPRPNLIDGFPPSRE
jgi:3-methyladenine DNA glycosylase AlkC